MKSNGGPPGMTLKEIPTAFELPDVSVTRASIV